jgi:peroxiredoxin
LNELRDRGLGLAAISYDRPEILADFSHRHGITFPLLSDAGSATIKVFGLLNTFAEDAVGPSKDDPGVADNIHTFVAVASVAPDAARIGMAFPGSFMLDRQGRVTSRFFEDMYIERNTVSSILMKLGGHAGSITGTKISTGQLELTTYSSDPAVAAGNRFALAVAIQPHQNMHVYAPGAASYRAVALTIAPQPFVRVLPLKYPVSEIYLFKPLKERVPIYRKPFTLVQEVVLEGTPQAQAALRARPSLTLTGTFDYQACDDKVCFNPASVPLSWTLTLRPLVFERPNRPRQ